MPLDTTSQSSWPVVTHQPLWYKDAVIYELPVKAFADSDGDGIGDFPGLTERLDYLQDLGVTALWLLPFFPSPLRDDGYDISDYYSVNPTYGTLEDFQTFLDEAHKRGLRVIIELVLNHTSDQHPWFQRARQAPAGSSERDFYVWSDTPEKYQEARIIFQDFETSNWSWDPIAKAYYWHRFYSHQPDLNFDNPNVEKALLKVVDFWLDKGVDGLRLDAVPYLYEREGSNCENLPETHEMLRKLRRHVDANYRDRMLLAEANQWPEDAAAYFGAGDECHMNFHFPLMPRLFMSVQMEDRFPIIDILQQTPEVPDNCQWAIFLRNHDELTLEMVTDEERDYMYQMYANDPRARVNLGIRRRLAPLLGNNRRMIELLNGLLFSLPGTPVLYYGDEIAMGDNIYLGDRNGVRTPMQWSADRNAGFSRANPQKLYLPIIIDAEYHYESVNTEAHRNNTNSLWWTMKRLIAIRKRYRAFGQGSFEFLYPDNRKVLAFVRTVGEGNQQERILVVANLSRYVQCVELDLSQYAEMRPTEIFGQTPFPAIGQLPYFLTLGPHSFYWFSLANPAETQDGDTNVVLPSLTVTGSWQTILKGEARVRLEAILEDYIVNCRWFGAKARNIQSLTITSVVPMHSDPELDSGRIIEATVLLLHIDYTEGDPQTYVLPIAYVTGEQALQLRLDSPQSQIATLQIKTSQGSEEGVIFDAFGDRGFLSLLMNSISRHSFYKGTPGQIIATTTQKFAELSADIETLPLEPRVLKAEQSNTSVAYGELQGSTMRERFILKLFRKVEEGVNPDLEIGRYLTETQAFDQAPAVAGALEYRKGRSKPITLAILQNYVPNEGDAWRFTLDELGSYFERVMVEQAQLEKVPVPTGSLLDLIELEIPELAYATIGTYLESARLLGQRTAELHTALGAATDDKDFAPEEFSQHYQRSLYQSMRNLVGQTFPILERKVSKLSDSNRSMGREVIKQKEAIMGRFRMVLDQRITAKRIRCHGDFHLGQVLYTGKDFFIIDFEGEPSRSLSERRLKRFPLRDVAGMLRSFQYAVNMALRNQVASGLLSEDVTDQGEGLLAWGQFWERWVSASFLSSYLEAASASAFLPQNKLELRILLDAYLLEKAIYELGYELNSRPDWVGIPLRGILQLMMTAVDDAV
ncbi:MAG: maltose alpha-D-glucosyltransferase [Synechococcaceae cyanobacterium SM2_3_2]|nr:maltose alpha-D-glucosyltransferase [Synechococcaceae cyanobacterium SM2_3_2]